MQLMTNKSPQTKTTREPVMGFWSATSIVVGILIGSGVFVKPAKVLSQVGTPSLSIAAWICGGLLTLASALTASELASRRPHNGGVYLYLKEAYGPRVAFLCGWIQSIIYGPALVAALALYFGSLLHGVWPTMPFSETTAGVIAAIALTAMNARSIGWGAFIQQTTTFLKILPIILISVVGLFFFSQPASAATAVTQTAKYSAFGAAILSTLWAYDGWILLTNVTSEVRNPIKTVPRALLGGIGFVIIAYVSVNIVLFKILGADALLANADKSAIVAAQTIFGGYGGLLISIGILISIFGCLNGCVLTGPHVPQAMSKRGQFVFANFFSEHPNSLSPRRNLVLQLVIALTYISMSAADFLTDLALFGMYFFYALAFTTIFVYRKKDKTKAPFRTPLYPVVPVIAVAGTLYVLISSLIAQPKLITFTVGVLAAGWIVYEAACKKAPGLVEEFV